MTKQKSHEAARRAPAHQRHGFFSRYSSWLVRNIRTITLIYVVLIALSILFLLRGGDDLAFHLQRMDAIMQTLGEKGLLALPIRLYDSTLWGYGYASPLFYCDLFFYPFAILGWLFHLSAVSAYKLMVACVWVATYLITYVSIGWIAGKTQRDVGVAIYMFGITIFANATDAAIGRAFAGMFVPLALCGLFVILHGKHDPSKGNALTDWIPVCLGMTGLVFSNVLDTAIVFVILLVLLAFSFKKITPKAILQILIAAVVALALTAWFLVPLLEQMTSDQYFASNAMGTFDGWTLPAVGLLLPYRFAVMLYSALHLDASTLSHGWMSGILSLALILIVSIRYQKLFDNRTFFIGAMVILTLGIYIQTPFTPLVFENKLSGMFQVPWRLGTVMYFAAALLAVGICSLKGKTGTTALCLTLSIFLLFLSVLSTYGYDLYHSWRTGEDYASYQYDSSSIGACDYVPTTFVQKGDADIFAWEDALIKRGQTVV